ncbi:MAG: hypothetical protein ACXVAX_13330 [Pseudobdellovibrio sp.]
MSYKLEVDTEDDQELVEIFFFRPASHKAENGQIYFKCHLEADGACLTERISATCEDRSFWQSLRKTVLLLAKQINNGKGINQPTVFQPGYHARHAVG